MIDDTFTTREILMNAKTFSKYYVEVPSKILTAGEQCGFDVYLKMDEEFVLFSSKELTISEDHVKIIESSQFQNVYVKKTQEDAYKVYMEKLLVNPDTQMV